MNTISTNVFRIEGLERYSAEYQLHRVRGLASDDEDYFRNLNTLSTRLSRELRTPATFVRREDEAFIVLRSDAPKPRESYSLTRATAVLDAPSQSVALDFSRLDSETRPIALRFLSFAVQGAFWKHSDLWQPKVGGTYFEKRAARVVNGIGLHRGFIVRAMDIGSGFGICVDVRHKYVAEQPLPAALSRKLFKERYKSQHAIYHYGRDWYEIRLEECNDLSATEVIITKDGRRWTLLEYVTEHCSKPLPPEVANLPKDCAVVHYYNGRDEKMAAPSALCFPVYDTESPRVRREHGRTILPPHIRLNIIEDFTSRYLQTIRLDGEVYNLSSEAVSPPRRFFSFPDIEFGNKTILSVNHTRNALQVQLSEVGKRRLTLLRDKSVGFFTRDAFHEQFFFMPESIYNSWGPRFLNDLGRTVDDFYPQEHGYSPAVIPYNDNCGPTWVDQSQAIFAAARNYGARRGFAVAMLHQPGDRKPRKEDQLAACVSQRLYKDFEIRAATMHTEVGSKAYTFEQYSNGSGRYSPRPDRRTKLEAYLRIVALNKVLLTNEKWPFVLAQPLHADITVGIDLKSYNVGLTLVGHGGRYIDTRIRPTRFGEHLRTDELAKHLYELIRQYHEREGQYAANVVIHRDGRMFESELTGARNAVEKLKVEGFVAPTAQLTCVEIGKHSYTSLRMFELSCQEGKRDFIENPGVGEYVLPTTNEGYVVTTGYPFEHEGTVLPLHVKKIEGALPMAQILEDVYRLTTLAWTRPDDCSRYPATIKINDQRLFEDVGEYDETELQLHEEEI